MSRLWERFKLWLFCRWGEVRLRMLVEEHGLHELESVVLFLGYEMVERERLPNGYTRRVYKSGDSELTIESDEPDPFDVA